MSPLLNVEPQNLRPVLHEQIDRLTDAELETVRRTFLELEAKRLADELGRAFEEDWRTGKLNEEKIAEAIREHRARHPYR